ncbi:MAG: 50S ribosomal protein L21 [Alphaproteobacteria bacterium]|nr:50S ribosomal protein L21 [Alphaproteobacteria bacterium]
MFAVVASGGKQYKVAAGDLVHVEKLAGNAGDSVTLDKVLAVGDKLGNPTVADATVKATIVSQEKGDKVIIFKKKRRQNYRRKNGHRQELTLLHVLEITVGGKSVAKAEPREIKKPKQAAAAPTTAKKAAKKAVAEKAAPSKKAEAKTEAKKTAAKKPAEKNESAEKKPAAKKPAAKKAPAKK